MSPSKTAGLGACALLFAAAGAQAILPPMITPFFDTGDNGGGASLTTPGAQLAAGGGSAAAATGTTVFDSALEVASTAGGVPPAPVAGSVLVPPFSNGFHFDPTSNSLVEDMGTTYGPPMSLSCAQYADYCKQSQQSLASKGKEDAKKKDPTGGAQDQQQTARNNAGAQGKAASGSRDGSGDTRQAAAAGGASSLLGGQKLDFGMGGGASDLNTGLGAGGSDQGSAGSAGSNMGSPRPSAYTPSAADTDQIAQSAADQSLQFLSLPPVAAPSSAKGVGAAETSGPAGGELSAASLGAGGCVGQVSLCGFGGKGAIQKAVGDMNALNAESNAKVSGLDVIKDPKTAQQHSFRK